MDIGSGFDSWASFVFRTNGYLYKIGRPFQTLRNTTTDPNDHGGMLDLEKPIQGTL